MLSIEQKKKLATLEYYSKVVVSIPVAAFVAAALTVTLAVFYPYNIIGDSLCSIIAGLVSVYAFYHTALYISSNKSLFFLRTLLSLVLAYSIFFIYLIILDLGKEFVDLTYVVGTGAYLISLIFAAVYFYKKPPFR